MKALKWLRSEFYIILALMLFTIMVSNDTFLPAMPIIAKYFDSSIATINFSFSVMMLGAFLPQMPIGMISDRVGRRPMILIGGALFLVSTFVIAHTNSLSVFMICRFLQGSASAFINSPARAMISEHYQYKKRVSAMATLSRLYLLAPLSGPLIGTYILTIANDDWHYIYIYNNVLFVFLFAIAIVYLPETLPKLQPQSTDTDQPSSNKPDNPPQQKESLLDLIKIKSYFHIVSAISWRIVSGVLWISGSAKVIMIDMGQSKEIYSYSQVAIFGSLILGTVITSRFAGDMAPSRYIRRHLLISGSVVFSLLALALIQYNFYTVLLFMAAVLFSNGAIVPVLQSIVAIPVKSKGFAMAVMMTVGSAVNVIGTAIPPLLYDYDSRWILVILGGTVMMATMFSWLSMAHVKKFENQPDN